MNELAIRAYISVVKTHGLLQNHFYNIGFYAISKNELVAMLVAFRNIGLSRHDPNTLSQ